MGLRSRDLELGTLGTGTNIAGTVPGQKSLGQPNAKLWDKLGLWSHGILEFHGNDWDFLGLVSPGILSPKGRLSEKFQNTGTVP